MDLLRVVLARQPLSKLLSLPRLLQQPAFVIIRIASINPRGFNEKIPSDYLQLCSAQGEISQIAHRYVALVNLRARAVFLREAATYQFHFDSRSSFDDGFWAAIASGIPEIQATAITMAYLGRLDHQNSLIPGDCKDPTLIPWTNGLLGAVRAVIGPAEEFRDSPVIRGYLRAPYPPEVSSIYRAQYIQGIVLRRFGDREVTTSVPELEDFFSKYVVGNLTEIGVVKIISGYTFDIRRFANVNNFLTLISVALKCCRLGAIRELARPGMFVDTAEYIITYKMQERVRQFLADPENLKLVSQRTAAEYRVIAGEIVDTPVSLPIRLEVSNPGPTRPGSETRAQTGALVRDITYYPLYAAEYHSDVMTAHLIAYVRGVGDQIEPYKILYEMYESEEDSYKMSDMPPELMVTSFSSPMLALLGLHPMPEIEERNRKLYAGVLERITVRP